VTRDIVIAIDRQLLETEQEAMDAYCPSQWVSDLEQQQQQPSDTVTVELIQTKLEL
jgi:hypothetical protein